ncbi:head-tail adaptor protein [uncultured Sphingomonas sp.]|uniref:head-tail adaptor protein n=1 Tax=uncultured Sphingomonas sp. TaxID=158754 RepID=UPI0025CDA68E|nr:head-tail adaptor protein [uncultured Sphingomonas sp.]
MAGFKLAVGRLNRTVRFERRVPLVDPLSAGEEAWEKVATVRAEVQDKRPSRDERLAEGMRIATRQARVITHYRRDIDASMRMVLDDGSVMQIVGGPAELGRRQALELVVEEYSGAGNA